MLSTAHKATSAIVLLQLILISLQTASALPTPSYDACDHLRGVGEETLRGSPAGQVDGQVVTMSCEYTVTGGGRSTRYYAATRTSPDWAPMTPESYQSFIFNIGMTTVYFAGTECQLSNIDEYMQLLDRESFVQACGGMELDSTCSNACINYMAVFSSDCVASKPKYFINAGIVEVFEQAGMSDHDAGKKIWEECVSHQPIQVEGIYESSPQHRSQPSRKALPAIS